MKENQPFQQGSRGCAISLLIIVLAIIALAFSTSYRYPQHISCQGMLGGGVPLLFICDDWGGSSPTSSWGKIDLVDVANGGIQPIGFFIDFVFYVVVSLIVWSAISSFLQKATNHGDLWWATTILIGFLVGFSFAFFSVWTSDQYIKNPPLGTATPVIPSATAAEPTLTITTP
ncbi:MAG TPA: hypothetical protein VFQ23_05690 [Anaerolineales bacterium]|nr:hypothetical protein [Anaerolineales bacterium]